MKSDPQPYEWDFDGACAPGLDGPDPKEAWVNETFSLGIFQWVPKAGGKGLKRSKSFRRVRGPVGSRAEVFAKAERIVADFNASRFLVPE
jgi:hypothetical protein